MPDLPDEIVPAELADVPPEVHQPPLSIGHLLLWIFGSALVLGSYRWLAEPTDRVGARYLYFLLDQLMRSVSLGAGVAAMLIYARRLVLRDGPLPRQPGHWLLVVHGLVWPAYWLALMWVYGLRGGDVDPRDWEAYRRYIIGTVLFYLWGTFLYVIVVACLREAKRWRMFFAVSAASPLIHALLWCCVWNEPGLRSLESYFILVRIAFTLPLLIMCVLRDRAEHIPRDWMHAAGVGFYVLGSLTSLGMYLLQLVMGG